MKKWEYIIVDKLFDSEDEFGDYLNALGENGWEYCSLDWGWEHVNTSGCGPPIQIVCDGIFKREKLS
jgi:hypothetical protein